MPHERGTIQGGCRTASAGGKQGEIGGRADAYDARVPTPVILFGAFDRHNFGDLLLAHVAAALLPGRRLVFAGLADRDLRRHGGHRTTALGRLLRDAPAADLIHVGGEILTCEAWQAAVMLLPPHEAQAAIPHLANRPQGRDRVRRLLGTAARVPYVVSRRAGPGLGRVVHDGVGGVDLDRLDPEARADVLVDLRAADAVGVRDRITLGHLASAGIAARLLPDPATLVADLFGARIGAHARAGEVARVRRAFPRGHVAVQFSADFGDDATAQAIAAQLDEVTARHGWGLALFRAGAAPWHDDRAVLARVATRLRPGSALLFESLDVWDICALIATGRAYCGSSLHGRIVAMAHALPRVGLRLPTWSAARPGKQAAYAATWDDASQPADVEPARIATAIDAAVAAPQEALQDLARKLVLRYRQGFEAMG